MLDVYTVSSEDAMSEEARDMIKVDTSTGRCSASYGCHVMGLNDNMDGSKRFCLFVA